MALKLRDRNKNVSCFIEESFLLKLIRSFQRQGESWRIYFLQVSVIHHEWRFFNFPGLDQKDCSDTYDEGCNDETESGIADYLIITKL